MPKLSKADQRRKISVTEAHRRKEIALARLREMEVNEKAGKLIRADAVRDAWVKILAAVKAGVLRLPDKLAPQMAAVSDTREAQKILKGECEAILKGLHDEIAYTAH